MRGSGHHDQSPYRLRSIERMRTAFGRGPFACRSAIERTYGTLTSFGGGLSPLLARVRVRHGDRVWLWVTTVIEMAWLAAGSVRSIAGGRASGPAARQSRIILRTTRIEG